MSSDSSLPAESTGAPVPSRVFTPLRTVAILAGLIFLAEIVAMSLLYLVRLPNYALGSLLDGIIMTLLIMPALYYLQLRPLLNLIAERAEAEQGLRASEELLRRVLELLPVGVWVLDRQGDILQGNQASQDIWAGRRYVGIPGYRAYKGWWPETGQPIEPEQWAGARAVTRGEITLNEEIQIEAFDGTKKVIRNSALPLVDQDGIVEGAVVVNQDITERRQMEKTLSETNELLERIFATVDTLIAYMDRDFNFIRVNDTYARGGGHPPDYFLGKNHFDLYPDEENLAIFRRVVESGEPFTVFEKPFEYPEFPERGVTYWDWSLQPIRVDSGPVEGVVLSLVDVTERKRAQAQLARQNEELRALSAAEHQQRELAESLVQATFLINTSLELDQVLHAILEQVRVVIPYQGASVMLPAEGSMRIASLLGFESFAEGVPAIGDTFPIADYPMLQQIYSLRQPIVIDSTVGHPLVRGVPGLEWVRAYLAAPLLSGSELIGIIILSSEIPGRFDQQAADRLAAFAAPAALALHKARMFAAEANARRFAETLSASAQALTQTLNLDQVLTTLLEHIEMVVASDWSGVGLLEDESHLSLRALRGKRPGIAADETTPFPLDDSMNRALEQVSATRKSHTFRDRGPGQRPPGHAQPVPTWNWLTLPILAGEKVLGLVILARAEEPDFQPEQIQQLEAVISQGAAAIQNAWLFQQVRAGSERLQSLTHRLVEIQENERYLIARELHDEAGQALSSLKLNLGRLKQDPDCPPHVSQQLEELKGVADQVLEELHRLAVDLRPAALDRVGLPAALEQHARKLTTQTLSVRFKALGFEEERLSKDVEISLYRIGQEALANIVRHAQAENVGVLLERGEGWVKLFVEDDGVGFDPEDPECSSRLGLLGMRERAEMLGGSLTIESSPGQGTSIVVEVPDGDSSPDRR